MSRKLLSVLHEIDHAYIEYLESLLESHGILYDTRGRKESRLILLLPIFYAFHFYQQFYDLLVRFIIFQTNLYLDRVQE